MKNQIEWPPLVGCIVGLILAALIGSAVAQVPCVACIASPIGTEQIQVLAPSTSGTGVLNNTYAQTVTINQIRNSEGYILVAAGTTVTTQVPNSAAVAIATGAITTWNVNMPTAPTDGQVFKATCPGGNTGTFTLTATLPAGVTIVGAGFTSCTQATPTDAAWHYAAASNIWYRTE